LNNNKLINPKLICAFCWFVLFFDIEGVVHDLIQGIMCPKRPRKTTNLVKHDNSSACQDSNAGPPHIMHEQ